MVLLLLVLLPAVGWAAQGAIFVYHRFGESRLPSTNIPLETFAA